MHTCSPLTRGDVHEKVVNWEGTKHWVGLLEIEISDSDFNQSDQVLGSNPVRHILVDTTPDVLSVLVLNP